MSEYQYYEFLAVDSPLTARQLDELRTLSTRARVTPSSFVNTYQWGDFRGDPRVLVEKYFDAFLYLANWGTRRLMLRLPERVLDLDVAKRYCLGESASAWTSGGNVIVDIVSEDEDVEFDEDGEGLLASIIPLRADLALGDLRSLYLAWLLCVQKGELPADEVEPPVPAGLDALTGSLRSLATFLRLDAELLAVAAAGSGSASREEESAAELESWVHGLPAEEKSTIVLRVLRGDDAQLRAELLRRFRHREVPRRGARRPAALPPVTSPRTVGELLGEADAHDADQQRAAAAKAVQARQRRELQAASLREAHLRELASRQDAAWQQVQEMIETKRPTEYDAAVRLLGDLRAVSEQQDHGEAFLQRLAHLRRQHTKKPRLLERLDKAGLVAAPDPPRNRRAVPP